MAHDTLHDVHFGSTFLHEAGADTDALFTLRCKHDRKQLAR